MHLRLRAASPEPSLLVHTKNGVDKGSDQNKGNIAPLDSCPWMFNPFKPNGISQHYQLEQSITVLRDVGCFFSNFNRTFQKQTVETLIRCRRTLHLVWVCTVWLCPTKRMLGLHGLMSNSTQIFFFYKQLKKTIIIFHKSLCRHSMTSIIASSQRYCVGNVPIEKLSCDYSNLIALNWPRDSESHNGWQLSFVFQFSL